MNWNQKKRFMRITATVFAVMLIILFAFVGCGSSEKEVTYEQQEEQWIEYAGVEEYEVQAFDTLSDIAYDYIPSGKYMAQWIEDVKELNNRSTSNIYYGETIKVYVYEDNPSVNFVDTSLCTKEAEKSY